MKILVIDQCSKAKDHAKDFTPIDEETIKNTTLSNLQEQTETHAIEARKLYAGRQQRFVDEAVVSLRSTGDEVDRYFISAGFGLIEETGRLPPYNVTFAVKSEKEIKQRGKELGIESQLIELIDEEYDLVYFALGADYYASFDLSNVLDELPKETWAVCFNHESISETFENVVSLPARVEQAKEQETIVVALKGRYLRNFAEHRSRGKQISGPGDIEMYCTEAYTSQSELDQ
jgi:hypothetical protein